MLLAKLAGFARGRPNQARGGQRRLRHAPWQSLAALVGVAVALWFAADLHPDRAGRHPRLRCEAMTRSS
jgi:hypothetical protein